MLLVKNGKEIVDLIMQQQLYRYVGCFLFSILIFLFALQANYRALSARRKLFAQIKQEFDYHFNSDNDVQNKLDSIELFSMIKRLLFALKHECQSDKKERQEEDTDNQCNITHSLCQMSCVNCKHLENVCKYIVVSLFSYDPHVSYVGVLILKPKLLNEWTQQVTHITRIVCSYLRQLKPEQGNHHSSLAIFLNVLVSFTSNSSWMILKNSENANLRSSTETICYKVIDDLVSNRLYDNLNDLLMRGLTRTKPTLKKLELTAIMTISIRPLQNINSYSDHRVKKFVLLIFSIPGLIYHLNSTAPEVVQLFCREPILKHCIDLLIVEEHSRSILVSLEGNYTLCLLANLVHLAFILQKSIRTYMIDFVVSEIVFYFVNFLL